jgi:hypothetical protein
MKSKLSNLVMLVALFVLGLGVIWGNMAPLGVVWGG